MNSVNVAQGGDDHIDSNKQAIIPQVIFTCSGKITRITATVRFDDSTSSNYPLFQVWRPVSVGSVIYDKIGEIQLESDDQVFGSSNNQLVIIIPTGNNTIEVQPGDVVGYYHPPQSRYLVRTIRTNGYILYQFNGPPNSNSVNLSNADNADNQRQPLIEFTIGKVEFEFNLSKYFS